MENIKEFLVKVSGIFVFCIGASLLLTSYKALSKFITLAKNQINDQNVLFEQYITEIEEDHVTYAEIIATLSHELEYDIKIDQLIIKKVTHKAEDFDFSKIPNNDFKKSYTLDAHGNIIMVIYQSQS